MALNYFFGGVFISFIPKITSVIILILAALKYGQAKHFKNLKYRNLIIAEIAIIVCFAAFQTIVQHYAWNQNPLTQLLLTLPLDKDIDAISRYATLFGEKGSYFAFYSFARFWSNSIISIFMSLVFYGFLKYVGKRNDRFFEEGEIELGFLMALLVGWPGFVLFLIFSGIALVLLSLIRSLFSGQKYTQMGQAFILACLAVIVLEPFISDALGLWVLKI